MRRKLADSSRIQFNDTVLMFKNVIYVIFPCDQKREKPPTHTHSSIELMLSGIGRIETQKYNCP